MMTSKCERVLIKPNEKDFILLINMHLFFLVTVLEKNNPNKPYLT